MSTRQTPVTQYDFAGDGRISLGNWTQRRLAAVSPKSDQVFRQSRQFSTRKYRRDTRRDVPLPLGGGRWWPNRKAR